MYIWIKLNPLSYGLLNNLYLFRGIMIVILITFLLSQYLGSNENPL